MTFEELKNAQATYELYGASMLSRETMEHLFALAIAATPAEKTAAFVAEGDGTNAETAKATRRKKGE